VIGNDLQACREALASNTADSLHLLERISIDLQVQNSIVPSALNLARFKVSGKLPSLQVNLSDTKYKALMRLIDVSIPKFDNDSDNKKVGALAPKNPTNFPLVPGGLFGPVEKEYHIDDDDDGVDSSKEEQFFETDDGSPEVWIVVCHKLQH